MKEYIEREAAVNAIMGETTDAHYPGWYAGKIAAIPAAPVREVVRGKWKKRMEEKETSYFKSFTPIWTCSECETDYDPSFCMTINFCPNCGTDMREPVADIDVGRKEEGGQT